MLASRCLYEATMEMERLLLHRIKIFFFFKDRKDRNVCGVARSNAFKICYPIQEGRRGRINYIEFYFQNAYFLNARVEETFSL